MERENNLWRGQVVSDEEFKKLFYENSEDALFWKKKPLPTDFLFNLLSEFCLSTSSNEIAKDYKEIEDSLSSLFEFLKIDNLRTKLSRELGSEFPFELKRINYRENHFESWYPLGVLVHITPNNSPLLGVLSVVEGLLSGNVNILKLARKDSSFAVHFYRELIKFDSSGILKDYIYIGKISSRDKSYLKDLLSIADVVSAWGGEESIKGIRELAPSSCRIVEWGHRISFSFITQSMSSDQSMLEKMAFEICNNEQMACSSPQCIFIENASFNDLKVFSKKLAQALDLISPTISKLIPEIAEKAEITVVTEQVRLGSLLEEAEVIISPHNDWRIFVENKSGLKASPLYRTIWVKPLFKDKIIADLNPLKAYLQTVGLSAKAFEVEELSQLFFQAGVQRIRAIGEMTESYIGEPHDGVFALERYCRRISFSDSELNKVMENKGSFFEVPIKSNNSNKLLNKIMEKSDFQNQKVDDEYSDLFFHSGGSSGEPKISIFTYEDYHRQMDVAAEGLFSAGLDPASDRCMNLFYAGNLYGGFVSFFSILEKLKAVQFPMGASADFNLVGETIVKNRVDTLLGMPSYFSQLFSANHALFKEYKGIKKLFYGGEHLSIAQRNFYRNEFGIDLIRSASYGSVDAGPLGFQCEFSNGGVHHLNERLHEMEVVELESDFPVKIGDVGRFLFTGKVRHGQKILRYAIGDVGRILEGQCACNRRGVRFELLGRFGDVFRIGTVFLSYQKFQKILIDLYEFEGSFQLHLFPAIQNKKEKVTLIIEKTLVIDSLDLDLKQSILENYRELNEVVNLDLVLDFEVELTARTELLVSGKTAKLLSVIDHRV